MARLKRKKREESAAELDMTSMIDVVFQLLIYFLVTFETPDVIAHLDVFRPSPDSPPKEQQEQPNMIRINIFPDGFTINERVVTLEGLDKLLTKLAGYGTSQTVVITCGSASAHGDLVRVLDICAKTGMKNLSVVSGN